MITSIIVPIDGSEFAMRAIPAAVDLATDLGASITLAGVAPTGDELMSFQDHVDNAAARLPDSVPKEEYLVVDEDPAAALLALAADPTRVLCVASHDHGAAAAAVRKSVGSHVLARAEHPTLAVGRNGGTAPGAHEVVVALDGRRDPEPLLLAAATWAAALDAPLRLVTVYEPVEADLRNPTHFTRMHGPSSDPQVYLELAARQLELAPLKDLVLTPLPDPVSVAGGLCDHLAVSPASLLVVGGHHRHGHAGAGVVRSLLYSVAIPLLIVPAAAGEPHTTT